MNTTKHTPAPWTVGHFNDVRSSDGYHSIANVSSAFELPAKANARLIAAAPDLLSALEDAEFLLRKAANLAGPMQDSFMRSAEDARAAIRKATNA